MTSDSDSEPNEKRAKTIELSDNEAESTNEVEIVQLEDDSDDDDNKEALELMRKFASITNTNEVMAHTILQDVSWSLEAALNVFYSSEEYSDIRKSVVLGTSISAVDQKQSTSLAGIEISIMSWNIDGLDGRSINTRMKAVRQIIKNVNPDFVFLQEVTERGIEPIERLSRLYDVYYSNRGAQYFTAILVSKMMKVKKHDVIHFQNSGMYRSLQIIEGEIGMQRVFLLNTHLESMKEHANVRRAQFAFCMDKIREIVTSDPDCLLFFGGDLNIRDEEMVPPPKGLADAWIAAGSQEASRWSWDMRKNDNLDIRGARMRFDRIFSYGPLRKVEFSLEGCQRIRSCLCFPSDHFAVHANFS